MGGKGRKSTKKGKKSGRKCGKCGKSGHNRRKCTSNVADVRRPERIHAAIDLLCAGGRYTEVRDQLAAHFQVDERTADTYISEARELIRQEMAQELPQRKQQLVLYLWRLARKAEGDGKYGDAVRAAQLIAKVDGLETVQQVEMKPAVIVVGGRAENVEDWMAKYGAAG